MTTAKKKKTGPKAPILFEQRAIADFAMPKMRLQTVLLNGEHALLRAFLRGWLSRFDKLHVVAEAGNASQAMKLVGKYKPALVLIDFDTLEGASLELLTQIRVGFPGIKVIIYFAYTSDDFAIKVVRAGASGFVLKSAESEDMERAIKTVMNGGVYLSPGFLKSLGTPVSRKGVYDKAGKILSPRLAEILKLTALGLSTQATAIELKISAMTAGSQKKILMTRLGIDSQAGLIKYAIKSGLVPA